MLDLKVTRGGVETLRTIQDNVASLLGVHIDAFSSEANQRGQSAELDVDDFLIEVNGSGIKEALRLVLDYEFTHPDILLVEEPEVHLHPALETAMMRYMKRISADSQVFITTHSTNFLDTADMRNVYLVGKNDSTNTQKLNIEDAETQIPKELGIRLSSLFMFDRLTFVEGPSDEAVLREFAATLGINLSEANVGFIAMGGVGNFTHYAAEVTISFLTKRRVDIAFILDRDERADDEVQKLEALLEGKGKIHILERRELENYLLVPRAVALFIEEKLQLGGTPRHIAPQDVSDNIGRVSEELRKIAIDKRVIRAACKPVYPSRKSLSAKGTGNDIVPQVEGELQRMIDQLEQAKGSLQEHAERYAAEIDQLWDEHKLDLVPGDELLDAVCAVFGARYYKERDAGRLAALLRPDEIAAEIEGIVRAFASPETLHSGVVQ